MLYVYLGCLRFNRQSGDRSSRFVHSFVLFVPTNKSTSKLLCNETLLGYMTVLVKYVRYDHYTFSSHGVLVSISLVVIDHRLVDKPSTIHKFYKVST